MTLKIGCFVSSLLVDPPENEELLVIYLYKFIHTFKNKNDKPKLFEKVEIKINLHRGSHIYSKNIDSSKRRKGNRTRNRFNGGKQTI